MNIKFTTWTAFLCVLTFTLAPFTYAGGPAYVAGVSYFNTGTKGAPITWSQGTITYFTDQGDLSPALPHAAADAFVADAFTRWTNIPTAAVRASSGGHLSEDVSGANVTLNSDGTISMPLDILATAVATPVAIVYDANGAVTDALLGQGASDSLYCSTNATFGGPDNLSTDAHIVHALVVLNGNCVQSSAQVLDMEYRLVRVLGRVFGLGWSQANPSPTSADYAGFPVMHALDTNSCVPISRCYPNADQPKMDDQAALSRLYPVTAQNQANFPGKTLFRENTVGIHGSVYFSDGNYNPTQAMQGVNVVGRWIDPTTGKPSRSYVATSVSGFLFCGNAGSPATGYIAPNGLRYDRFGSNDATVEGFFDLSGLQIPNGAQSAQFQLTVENTDPLLSQGVGPYAPFQVQSSGTAVPVVVTANLGADVQQDIVMSGSAIAKSDPFRPTTYSSPTSLPSAGEWLGSITGYGDADYFWFLGHADRTLSVEVTALNETGAATENKLLPVIGMWGLSDPGTFPAPAHTSSALNTNKTGTSQLNASLLQTTPLRIGISDQRGDGRPDYRYRARVFYGDTLTLGRSSTAGGAVVAVKGFGFHANTSATVAGSRVTPLAVSPGQVILSTPAHVDGVADIGLSDPATGATSTMSGVLTYGAAPGDGIALISGANPAIPVGGLTRVPVSVRVVAQDGVTPVVGASVVFSSSPAAALTACNGGNTCAAITDQGGMASTFVMPLSAGAITITIQLAPAAYNPAKLVQATIVAVSSTLDLSLNTSTISIAQGATADIPIIARALSNGSPLSGQTVTYSIVRGPGTFGSTTAITNATGYATNNLHVTALSSQISGNLCVNYGGATNCQNLNVFPVPAASLQVQPIAGSIQEVKAGMNFQPLTVRVTDSSTPPFPVMGATVVFQSIIGRAKDNAPIVWAGGTGIGHPSMPVILASSQISAVSDANGIATMQPSAGTITGPVLILGTASSGSGSVQYQLQSVP